VKFGGLKVLFKHSTASVKEAGMTPQRNMAIKLTTIFNKQINVLMQDVHGTSQTIFQIYCIPVLKLEGPQIFVLK
jgi:hypothetical protein